MLDNVEVMWSCAALPMPAAPGTLTLPCKSSTGWFLSIQQLATIPWPYSCSSTPDYKLCSCLMASIGMTGQMDSHLVVTRS